MRVPDLAALEARTVATTFGEAAQRWQESRVDVAENTRLQHRTALRKALPVLGKHRLDTITAQGLPNSSLSSTRWARHASRSARS